MQLLWAAPRMSCGVQLSLADSPHELRGVVLLFTTLDFP